MHRLGAGQSLNHLSQLTDNLTPVCQIAETRRPVDSGADIEFVAQLYLACMKTYT